MNRRALLAVGGVLLADVLLALSGTLSSQQAARLGAVVLLGAVCAMLIDRLPSPRAADERFEGVAAPGTPVASRPATLEQLERIVQVSTQADVHYRLRPVLSEIAAVRLRERRRVRLEVDAPVARALLGEELYAIVRPGRPEPADRNAPTRLGGGDILNFAQRLENL